MKFDDLKFIKLGARSKVPIAGVPWKKPGYQYSYTEIQNWIKQGNNYGVITGYKRLVVLDIDNVQRCSDLEIQPYYETYTVRTGSGGFHFYYQVEVDEPRKVIFCDSELKEKDGSPLHLGELQATGHYVVASGSAHPNGDRYEVINDAPINDTITYREIVDLFREKGVLLTIGNQKSEKAAATRVGNNEFHIEDVWSTVGMSKIGHQYCGEHSVHGSKTGHNLVIDPLGDQYFCFRCGRGGGPYEALAVDSGILKCSEVTRGCLQGFTWFELAREARKRGFSLVLRKPKASAKPKRVGCMLTS